jgi:methionyl-tRNA formyltransferase
LDFSTWFKKTATTFFRIDERADTDHILSQKTLLLLFEDTDKTLYKKLLNNPFLK